MENMKRTAILLLGMLATLVALAGSCSQGSRKTPQTPEVHKVGAKADTVTVNKPEPKPQLKFNSPEEAIAYMKESGHWEEYSKGILPTMAEDALPYATKLLDSTHDGFVVVDKGRMRVIKFDKYGNQEASYKMACARKYGNKHAHNDMRTPEGFFSVNRVQNSTEWRYTDPEGHTSQKKGEYGPRFIRLNIPITSSIGIHGTCAPWSLGGRRSHGCIRIKNENILALVEMVDSGMPVIITPGAKDLAVDRREGDHVLAISTIPGKHAPKLMAELASPVKADTINPDAADLAEVEPSEIAEVDSVAKMDSVPGLEEELEEEAPDSVKTVTI